MHTPPSLTVIYMAFANTETRKGIGEGCWEFHLKVVMSTIGEEGWFCIILAGWPASQAGGLEKLKIWGLARAWQ